MRRRQFLGILVVLVGFAPSAYAQTLDCDAAQQPSQIIRTGQAYTVQFCVPSTVTNATDGTVPNRIDGFKMTVDADAPIQAGKLTLGPPTPTLKLSLVTWRSPAGVQKGSHNVTVIPWNYPLMPDGTTPDTTKPPQEAGPLLIPFSANDAVLSTAPPAATKGRVIR